MNSRSLRSFFLATAAVAMGSLAAHAQTSLAITEVYSAGSDNATYAADWFELTNFGTTAIDLSAFRMDDASESPLASVALRGVSSLAAGQSAIFIEGNATGTTDAALASAFKTAWFGNAPTSLLVGGYGGTSVTLGASADEVAIYDPSSPTPNVPVTTVFFGAATAGRTFDNATLVNSYVPPFAGISLLSSVGVNGAFLSANGQEIGSPGAIPEPSTYAAIVGALVLAGTALVRHRTRATS